MASGQKIARPEARWVVWRPSHGESPDDGRKVVAGCENRAAEKAARELCASDPALYKDLLDDGFVLHVRLASGGGGTRVIHVTGEQLLECSCRDITDGGRRG